MDNRQVANLEARATDYGSAVKACRDRLDSQGIRLAQYSTSAMAADVRDIVELLEYEQVNLYGVSFGASVAQVVLRDHPDIVRSVVLDSAFPLQGNFYNEIAGGTERALLALFEACRADVTCNSQYPNLEGVFNELVGKLEGTPLGVDTSSSTSSMGTGQVVDALRFQEVLRLALLSPALIPDIPQGIYALRYGDTAFAEAVLSAPRMHYTDPALGAMISILCTEQAYATSPSSLEASLEAYPRTATLARFMLYGSGKGLMEICDLWQAAPFDAQVKRLPAGTTPALILSGALDPLYSADLAGQLSRAGGRSKAGYVVEFPGLGQRCEYRSGGCLPAFHCHVLPVRSNCGGAGGLCGGDESRVPLAIKKPPKKVVFSARGATRTRDPLLRKQML
jgi:pimeloyl-ACP methyl ester carboxylesterase